MPRLMAKLHTYLGAIDAETLGASPRATLDHGVPRIFTKSFAPAKFGKVLGEFCF